MGVSPTKWRLAVFDLRFVGNGTFSFLLLLARILGWGWKVDGKEWWGIARCW